MIESAIVNQDHTEQLQQQVSAALANNQPVNIRAGGSKSFLGLNSSSDVLDVAGHSGIVSYEPSELVITARSGTPLAQIKQVLAEQNQALPFEPPAYGPGATLGGTMACSLSGPARPYTGAARDYALGCRIINGRSEVLRFGGEVMKNVAGYDVTRLMTGAMGTLGVILDFSLKVLPQTETELTLAHRTDIASALTLMQALAGRSQPVTASAYHDGVMYTRLAGTGNAVAATAKTLAGDTHNDSGFWSDLREHQLDFFNSSLPLWRISVPPLTEPLNLSGNCLYDWAGTQRWLFSEESASNIRQQTERAGGHAQLYRADETLKAEVGVFHPPSSAVMDLHRNLKKEFDPAGILNPGRLYPGL